jgi:uncharacterized protein (DUF58 family)
VAVVVSDFVGAAGWERPLRALAARHDTVAIEVVDPRELSLPDVGLLTLVDPETGRRLEVQTGDRQGQGALRPSGDGPAQLRWRLRCGAAGADHLVLRTDRDWLVDVVRFVARRRRRRTAVPARPVAVPG